MKIENKQKEQVAETSQEEQKDTLFLSTLSPEQFLEEMKQVSSSVKHVTTKEKISIFLSEDKKSMVVETKDWSTWSRIVPISEDSDYYCIAMWVTSTDNPDDVIGYELVVDRPVFGNKQKEFLQYVFGMNRILFEKDPSVVFESTAKIFGEAVADVRSSEPFTAEFTSALGSMLCASCASREMIGARKEMKVFSTGAPVLEYIRQFVFDLLDAEMYEKDGETFVLITEYDMTVAFWMHTQILAQVVRTCGDVKLSSNAGVILSVARNLCDSIAEGMKKFAATNSVVFYRVAWDFPNREEWYAELVEEAFGKEYVEKIKAKNAKAQSPIQKLTSKLKEGREPKEVNKTPLLKFIKPVS